MWNRYGAFVLIAVEGAQLAGLPVNVRAGLWVSHAAVSVPSAGVFHHDHAEAIIDHHSNSAIDAAATLASHDRGFGGILHDFNMQI